MLEHHAHLGTGGIDILFGHFLPIQENMPAGGFFQPVQAAQEGGFAAAGRAYQADHVSLFDIQADAVQHGQLSETLFQVFNGDHSASASFPAYPTAR